MSLAALSDTCRPCQRGNHEMCTLHDKCGCETCNPVEALPFVWEDPPNPHGRGPRMFTLTDAQRLALAANPGRWARVKEYKAKSGASTAAKKLRTTNPGWEYVGRVIGEGSALYVRFVGES